MGCKPSNKPQRGGHGKFFKLQKLHSDPSVNCYLCFSFNCYIVSYCTTTIFCGFSVHGFLLYMVRFGNVNLLRVFLCRDHHRPGLKYRNAVTRRMLITPTTSVFRLLV